MLNPDRESAVKVRNLVLAFADGDSDRVQAIVDDLVDGAVDATTLLCVLAESSGEMVAKAAPPGASIAVVRYPGSEGVPPQHPQLAAIHLALHAARGEVLDVNVLAAGAVARGWEYFVDLLNVLLHMQVRSDWLQVEHVRMFGDN